MTDKPSGKFKCLGCEKIWDGNQLYQEPKATNIVWTCGNLLCGALVQKIKD